MGIHEGHALADAAAPAFGRTINIGAETERNVANMPLAQLPQTSLPAAEAGAPPNAGMYPGYPQDMFMVKSGLRDDVVPKSEVRIDPTHHNALKASLARARSVICS